jgi:capsular polysaccharide biosynthesis protein
VILSRAQRWIARKRLAIRQPRVAALDCFVAPKAERIWVNDACRLSGKPPLNYQSFAAMGAAGFDPEIDTGIAGQILPDMIIGDLGNCYLAEYIDPHRGHRHCFFDSHRKSIDPAGTQPESQPESQHQVIYRRERATAPTTRGAWLLDHWLGNDYHWIVFCLPKALALIAAGKGSDLLLPAEMPSPDFITSSLDIPGMPLSSIRGIPSPLTHFSSLSTVEGGRCSPASLQMLRAKLLPGPALMDAAAPQPRYIYITRQNALRRRLVNEDEVLHFCRSHAIAVLDTESLDFRTQLTLFSQARLIIGLHGAGLTNMTWMPAESHVVEIIGSKEAFPHYHQLALSLGHNYWVVNSAPAGQDSEVRHQDEDYLVALPQFFDVVTHALNQITGAGDS